MALSFDRHRALPAGVPDAIRAAILGATDTTAPPRLLDLGAGTGRIGWPFIAARDDYVGVDSSLGMLREFARRALEHGWAPRLMQADGHALPFPGRVFDAVMLMQVMSPVHAWRELVVEARRVLRPRGVLVLGHTRRPPEGVDARMKHHLASLLDGMGIPSPRRQGRSDTLRWLDSVALRVTRAVAAVWIDDRSPRAFLDRQETAPRLATLPASTRGEVLRELGRWGEATFGSLEAVVAEEHAFELWVASFPE